MWDSSNYTVGNIEGGQEGYDCIMKDLDPGFFPIDNPRLSLGNRAYGHCMIVIGSDPKRELFLCQNSYGLFDNMQRNIDAKPYLWIPYNYFRTRIIDATWVIRAKKGNTLPPPPPLPKGQVTIQFSDNQSGANIDVPIAAGVGPQQLTSLLVNSNIGKVGFITSVQLEGAPSSAVAVVKKNGQVLGTVKATGNDYAQFPRTPLAGTTIEVTV